MKIKDVMEILSKYDGDMEILFSEYDVPQEFEISEAIIVEVDGMQEIVPEDFTNDDMDIEESEWEKIKSTSKKALAICLTLE